MHEQGNSIQSKEITKRFFSFDLKDRIERSEYERDQSMIRFGTMESMQNLSRIWIRG